MTPVTHARTRTWRYAAIADGVRRSQVSPDREEIDRWAADEIKTGARIVRVYAAPAVIATRHAKTGEQVGLWIGEAA